MGKGQSRSTGMPLAMQEHKVLREIAMKLFCGVCREKHQSNWRNSRMCSDKVLQMFLQIPDDIVS